MTTQIPSLRFPQFAEEWEEKTLDKVAEIVGGGTPDTKQIEFWNGNIQWFTPTEIKNNFVYQSERKITEKGLKNSSAKLLPVGTVLFTTRATIGDVAIAKVECTTNQGFQSFIVNKDNSNYFLLNWLKLHKDDFIKLANGSTFLEVSKKAVSNVLITLPPTLAEQTQIANFLTAVDTRLSLLKQKHELLKSYKKGIMAQIFNQELRFKDENGQEFPAWEEKTLGEIADINKGTQFNKILLSETGKYPCLNGGIFPSGYSEKYNYNENTITISEGGNSCGFVNFMKTKFWCGGHCYAVIIKNNLYNYCSNLYLFQLLKYNEKNIMELRLGGALPNIQKKDLIKIILSIPCLAEQTKIANFLTAIDNKINNIGQQIAQSEEWKRGLLQAMLV